MAFPDISLPGGDHLAILGSSGSGKTTLLHILSGLLKPSAGSIHIHGESLYDLSPSKLDRFRGQSIGLIFQQAYFIQSISVEENLAWAQHLAGKKTDRNRIHLLLERLHIDHHRHHLASQLSVGEQQRASIARALVNKPAIIFADEPTSALDDPNAQAVIQLLQEQAKQDQASLVVVTHDGRIKPFFTDQIQLGL
jgi:ABC-type lipoprotein export system ATPase subunit